MWEAEQITTDEWGRRYVAADLTPYQQRLLAVVGAVGPAQASRVFALLRGGTVPDPFDLGTSRESAAMDRLRAAGLVVFQPEGYQVTTAPVSHAYTREVAHA